MGINKDSKFGAGESVLAMMTLLPQDRQLWFNLWETPFVFGHVE